MNYIRTEDGIYEVVEADDLEIGNDTQVALSLVYKGRYFSMMENGIGDCITVLLNEKIIKQANEIEELCDEFIVVNNNCFNTPQLLGTCINKDYYKHEEIYGAVWCEFGLKYVAKLNSKGELELI